MTQRSKSTLFLIEQLIVIAVFAICAAACISILTTAYFYTKDSAATNNAILKAESAAELFKATGGDYNHVADMLGGSSSRDSSFASMVTVYYDSLWNTCTSFEASYVLRMFVVETSNTAPDFTLIAGNVTVERVSGEELIFFPVAARAESGVMRHG